MSQSQQDGRRAADLRRKIIGLGDKSLRKNYYPELKRRIAELEAINEELRAEIYERELAEERTRNLEAQLKQGQKMEAIGTLAGGIAHDFNNILTAIIGYTELARINIPADSPGLADLDQVLKAGHRARELVKQILAFSRQDEQEKLPVHLQKVVREALGLLRSSIPSSIEIREHGEPGSHDLVLADPTQIHQIIMNLATNASHAMQEHGGILSVGLRSVVLDRDDTQVSHPHLAPGPYLILQVSDTGTGMERSTLDRIFDPYFTTKEKGAGTGMGLAVVHGIVKRHNGFISVYSEVGQGTTFHVYLPAIFTDSADTGTRDEGVPRGDSERILVVDDEANLVEMTGRLLHSLGYRVVADTSPVAALSRFRSHPDSFDLVITDMTMPGMDGLELVKSLFRVREDIPVIICTGFSERLNEEIAKALGIREYVMKPIVRAEIARVVRQVLDQQKRLGDPSPPS